MSESLDYWRGPAGESYIERNPVTPQAVEARRRLWSEITNHMLPACPKSVLEVGANIGLHLRGLKAQLPGGVRYFATEPNQQARERLIDDGVVDQWDVYESLQMSEARLGGCDLIYTSGVMIHVEPSRLLDFCRTIHSNAKRWIVAIEYFNQTPVEIEYRGEMGRLFKRDFGGFYLDNFPDLHPIACGFGWSRMSPTLDDVTWTLLERR